MGVIDEFVLEIGLDPSKFNEGRRKLDDELGKGLHSVENFGKGVEQTGTKISEIFGITKTGVAGIIATFMGAEAGAFIEKVQTMEASTSRLADSIGLNRKELALWQNMVGLVGGTAGEANQTIAGLNDALMSYRAGLAQPSAGFAQLMSQAGINYLSPNVSPTDVLQGITKYLSGLPEQDRRLRLQQVPSMSDSVMYALLKGAENLAKFNEQLARFSSHSQEAGDAAQRIDADIGTIKAATREFADALLGYLAPVFDWLKDKITSNFGHGIIGGVGGLTAGAAAGALVGGIIGSVIPGAGTLAGAGIGSGIGAYLGAAGGIWGGYQLGLGGTPSGAAPSTGGGNSRGDRNNNPGNVKYGAFAIKHGATGADSSGFAIFPTWDTGANAAGDLLHDAYQGLTLAQIQSRWVGNSDSGYLSQMMKSTGLGPNDVPNLNDSSVIMKLLKGMMQGEGTHVGGGSNSTVTIGTINVTSSKSDPKAVADQIPDAMRRSSMMNSVNSGLT